MRLDRTVCDNGQNRGNAPNFWHKEDWKDGGQEGRKFSVYPYIKPDGSIKPAGFAKWRLCWVSLRFWGLLKAGKISIALIIHSLDRSAHPTSVLFKQALKELLMGVEIIV